MYPVLVERKTNYVRGALLPTPASRYTLPPRTNKGGTFMRQPIKTLIELYDKQPMENILGACIFSPAMVVYICDARDSSMRKEMAVERLFKRRKMKTKARFYYIDTSNPEMIWRTFEAVVRDYPDCVFDCTGGKDLVLLQAGLYCREKNVPAYYIDPVRGKFVNVIGCEYLREYYAMPHFSAEDLLAIAGAQLVGYGHYNPGELTDDFEADVFRVWPIVCRNPAAWGRLVAFFQAVSGGAEHQLVMDAPHVVHVNRQSTVYYQPALLHELEEAGILSDLQIMAHRVRFTYKNIMIKNCLQNHGIWLELYAYYSALRCGCYDDVRTSVVVDWDNARGTDRSTRNEIDVLMVKGIQSVFVSCKMGAPTPLALSEIKILSQKFGGENTKTIVLTASDVYERERSLLQRARDLDIILIDQSTLKKGDLARRFQSLVLESF